MGEKRQHTRTPFRSRVKLSHADFDSIMATTRDLSDTGIYVFEDTLNLNIGTVVSVQIQDTPMEAPIVEMIVVRRDPEGYGLQFLRE